MKRLTKAARVLRCRMIRSASIIAALGVTAGLCSCGAPERDAVEVDFIIGDQCFYSLDQRPDDCYERAPCMWSDADLHVREDENGMFSVEAGPGGWEVRSEPSERVVRASASSPEALARQLPQLLEALHDSPPPISQSCIAMNPDQDMRVGDLVAFHRALTNLGVRKVQLFAVLVDDPLRFVRITLSGPAADEMLVQQMRRFADENGFVFSQLPWQVEHRFQIVGDGLAIAVWRVDAPESQSAFRAMLELSPRSNGTLPTEPMMDRLLETFTAAATRVDGTAVSLEQTSRELSSTD